MTTRNDPATESTTLPITGTALEVSVRRLLLSLHYPRCVVGDALSWIGSRGTIAGIPVIDRADWPAVYALVARHTGDVVSDPRDWPAWTDFDRWAPTEPEPSELPSAVDLARLDALDT